MISDHVSTAKTRIKVMTVDPANRRVEGVMKDGSMIQIAVWDVPHAFRWPKEGEEWLVQKQGTVWMLCNRQQFEKEEATKAITTMNPGEMILDSETVMDAKGKTMVAVDITGIEDGWTIKWSASLGRFVAGP